MPAILYSIVSSATISVKCIHLHALTLLTKFARDIVLSVEWMCTVQSANMNTKKCLLEDEKQTFQQILRRVKKQRLLSPGLVLLLLSL